MVSEGDALAAIIGDTFRRARVSARLLQREVAARAGISPTMLCRMELGRGGAVPLSAWAAVAAVLDLDLVPDVQESDGSARAQLELRCHGLVTEVAREGGWQAMTEIVRPSPRHAPEAVETVLVRPNRREVAVVHAWHPVPNLGPAVAALETRLEHVQRRYGPDWLASALVVSPTTTAGRRRVTEQAPTIATVLSANASEWMAALRHLRSAMPAPGLVWTDRWAVRFRPAPRRPGWQREG